MVISEVKSILGKSNMFSALEYIASLAESDKILKLPPTTTGPGCSLDVGAFSEIGPFRRNVQGLLRNEYSWNTEANMLYLETPVGVGFSYDSSNSSAYEVVTNAITARHNLVFLHKWFLKLPQYQQMDLFITGESCAGTDEKQQNQNTFERTKSDHN